MSRSIVSECLMRVAKNCFSLSTSSGLCSPFRNASEKRFSVAVDSVAIKIVFKDKMRFILLVRRHPEQNL